MWTSIHQWNCLLQHLVPFTHLINKDLLQDPEDKFLLLLPQVIEIQEDTREGNRELPDHLHTNLDQVIEIDQMIETGTHLKEGKIEMPNHLHTVLDHKREMTGANTNLLHQVITEILPLQDIGDKVSLLIDNIDQILEDLEDVTHKETSDHLHPVVT